MAHDRFAWLSLGYLGLWYALAFYANSRAARARLRQGRRAPRAFSNRPRATRRSVRRSATFLIAELAWLGLGAVIQGYDAESLGFTASASLAGTLLTGASSYALLYGIALNGYYGAGRFDVLRRGLFMDVRATYPNGRRDKCVALGVRIGHAMVGTVLTLGVLVHQLGEALGSPGLAALIAVVFCCVRRYRDWGMLGTDLLFLATGILILYASEGLAGTVVFMLVSVTYGSLSQVVRRAPRWTVKQLRPIFTSQASRSASVAATSKG